jgi:hypothetical protein
MVWESDMTLLSVNPMKQPAGIIADFPSSLRKFCNLYAMSKNREICQNINWLYSSLIKVVIFTQALVKHNELICLQNEPFSAESLSVD